MKHTRMTMTGFRRRSVFLLPVMLTFLLNSCASHYLADRSLDTTFDPTGESVRLFWGEREFELTQSVVKDEILTGALHEVGQKSPGAVSGDSGSGQGHEFQLEAATHEARVGALYVFVDPLFPLIAESRLADGSAVAIPFANITKVQVVEHDVAAEIVRSFGVMVLAVGVASVIYVATKDSCPFIYVGNGEDRVLVGEIYSGAIHRPLERDDYLALPVSGDGACNLMITNEVLEIQHTNLAELLVYDHAVGERLLVDRHGAAHLLARPSAPLSTRSFADAEVPDDATNSMDSMVLTFARPAGAAQMKLIVNARNSRWLDHVMGILFERMGDLFRPWQEAQKTGSAAAMRQWSLDQGLPLKVSLMTPDGWRFVDYFDLPGPIAARDAVMAFDLADVSSDEITIKLECGYRFWEINAVLADFTTTARPVATPVGLARAVTREGWDVAADLRTDDDRYLHQPNVGDETLLDFDLPDLPAGMARSVILHSKGHYDILRRPEGQPEAAFVASFREPGRMTEFSRELHHALNGAGGR